ncbi:alpha/beta fold hydrolase [Sphingobacterium sp. UDSM-2020]|uniref:alpha/beta fold hydrolase n=1 Tax=Sphingobacterium sp. UDSM-2020 TaxID=2795738 RepID=UPI00193631A2|nr:alpha/beta hydrolase [Sphingobacterium sp. UDSM-2020]QQD13654.1 alpha/beta hydrolase [Sphingobacterium sp. UDSM-2020]
MSKKETKLSKIRIDDISISYMIRPSKTDKAEKTVIFLHGFPFNKNMWRAQMQQLDEQFIGIAIDIRGHGHSTRGHGFFSVDVFAKDLIQFITHLNLNNVVLCGVSMGGYIALRTYELIGSTLQGLILSDTHSFADNNMAKQKRFDSIQALLKYGKRPFSLGFIETVFSKKTLTENPEAIETIKSAIRRNDLQNICATQLALAARTDTTAMLNTITVPTLVIKGKEDKLITDLQTKTLLDNIGHVKFIEFTESGHLPNLEEPEKFSGEVNSFLNSL